MTAHILVGQLVDEANNNPQCLNARALLSRSSSARLQWTVPHYGAADPLVEASRNVRLVRLWRRSLWMSHKFLFYQRPADAIFYPGVYWFDDLALQLRRKMGRRIPVIATMEGLVGDEARERTLSQWAGRRVFCQRVATGLQKKIDRVLGEADHVIAISPFIAAMGKRLYGDKFSVVSLGVDRGVFFPSKERRSSIVTVAGAGRLYENKRAHLFIEMARRFPSAFFVWYGDGELRESLQRQATSQGVGNVAYRSATANRLLGQEFRNADLFVLPSRAEGVPKVVQEAAACGLPAIVFGFYEGPTVRDGENGYVVWSDDQLFARVGACIADPASARRLGLRGAELAAEWDWEKLAPRWEQAILDAIC